ncbi:phage tail protein [Hafnia paralvei]|uniref:phage tail protein n=1 Tax=Hafnia paralvei TaxID=546367 RepID=UPI00300CDB10
MAQKYKAVLTKIGAAKIAAATAGGTKINLTQMAVGDGGGTLPTPDPAQTELIAEKHRAALNKVIVDPKHKNYLVAELVIPPEIGGFWMRELGLYDEVGALIAVSNMAESYKPLLSEGSGRAQTLRMVVIVSDMDTVNLLIDSSTVLATQEYVDDKLQEHEQSRRHPDATLKEKGFTQLSSATNSTSEALAATPKAVKTAYDLANGKYTAQDATTTQKGIVQLNSATNSTSETLAATPKAVKAAYDKATEADKKAQTADENADKANENANVRLEKNKNLSDLSDKPLARKNLELGNAATLNAQKTVTDTTDGAVLVVGKSFGLGFGNVVNPRPDPSTFPPSGFYTASANDIGLTQLPGGYVGLITLLGGTAYRNEIALEKSGRMFIRGADGSNVPSKNWYECFTENHKPTAYDVEALPSDGNAVSASKLKNARNIAGIAFDGTKDIAISAADVGTYTKNEIDNKLGLKGNKSTANLGVSGWWRDGSTGLLIQWGTQRSVDANGVSFNYPIAFNAVYGGLATIKTNVSIDGNNAAYFFTPNLTTGTVVNDPATTGRVCDVFWVAFGA